MAYYLQWANSGAHATADRETLEISGIVGAIASVEYTVQNTPPAYVSARYIYDNRRLVGGGAGTGGNYLFQTGATTVTTITTNYRKNGVVFTDPLEFFSGYVAGDVFAFDDGQTPSEGAISIGARATSIEAHHGLAISEIIITDANGAHTINMSDSGGTGTSLASTDAALTATLYYFPADNSQWVPMTVPPSMTLNEPTLSPGDPISGTYADYETIPTTLTVSDGTNTITIANPGIVDDAAGGGTFSTTMPALPTTGTANLVLFGDVTVELA